MSEQAIQRGIESAFSHAGQMAANMVQEAWSNVPDIARAWQRPSVLYRPSLARDGNKWSALYGDNLMEGVCGYGDTPEEAMDDFDHNWRTQRITVAATESEVVVAPEPEPEPPMDPEEEAREAWARACSRMSSETGHHVNGDGWRWWGGLAFQSTRAPILIDVGGAVSAAFDKGSGRRVCNGRGGWLLPAGHPIRVEAERVVAAVNAWHDEKARAVAADREARLHAEREQVEADLAAVSAMLTGGAS